MSEDGYTAIEALAALAILGLAIGGLTGGMKVLGQGELATSLKTAQAVSIRQVSSEFAKLLEGQGPFRSDAPGAFVGEARSFSFPCGGRACHAQLSDTGITISTGVVARTITVPDADQLQFSFIGSQSEGSVWPAPVAPPPAPQWQVLQSIVLQEPSTGQVLTTIPIPIQQAANCEYDSVIQDCRKAGS